MIGRLSFAPRFDRRSNKTPTTPRSSSPSSPVHFLSFGGMSAQQPRAYNYVATQDFSANSSQGAGAGTGSDFSSPQYRLEPHHHDPSNDMNNPPPPQQHFNPLSETPQQSHQVYAQNVPTPANTQSSPKPPPVNPQSRPNVNYQSHPSAPPLNYQLHPPPNEYKPSQPPAQQQALYGVPSQQGGQMSFEEKFRPPSDKPKWNDVFPRARTS